MFSLNKYRTFKNVSQSRSHRIKACNHDQTKPSKTKRDAVFQIILKGVSTKENGKHKVLL